MFLNLLFGGLSWVFQDSGGRRFLSIFCCSLLLMGWPLLGGQGSAFVGCCITKLLFVCLFVGQMLAVRPQRSKQRRVADGAMWIAITLYVSNMALALPLVICVMTMRT